MILCLKNAEGKCPFDVYTVNPKLESGKLSHNALNHVTLVLDIGSVPSKAECREIGPAP